MTGTSSPFPFFLMYDVRASQAGAEAAGCVKRLIGTNPPVDDESGSDRSSPHELVPGSCAVIPHYLGATASLHHRAFSPAKCYGWQHPLGSIWRPAHVRTCLPQGSAASRAGHAQHCLLAFKVQALSPLREATPVRSDATSSHVDEQ